MTTPSSSQPNASSPFSIGQRGNFNGHSVEIVGYIRYEGYDDDDPQGSNRASGEEDKWYFEEWYLQGSSKNLWLQYEVEEDLYTLFEQIKPTLLLTPSEFRVNKKIKLTETDECRIDEVADATVMSFAGTLPWEPAVGESMKYVDAHDRLTKYSIEIDDDDPQGSNRASGEETEVYKGKNISLENLFEGFRMTDKLALMREEEENKLKVRPVRALLHAIVLIAAVATVIAYFGGKTIYEKKVVFCPESSAAPNITSTSCQSTTFPIGPIALSKNNRVYKIEVTSLTASRTNAHTIDLNLLKENKAISGFTGDFWVEDWSEGGESGTESHYKASTLFRLEEAGTYYLDMDIDKETTGNTPDVFVVKVYQEIFIARYFIGLGIVSFLLNTFTKKTSTK